MAVTVRTMTLPRVKSGRTYFGLSAYSADAQNTEEIKAAPAAGSKIYITKLIIVADFDGYVTIGDGESGNAVETARMDIVATATGISVSIDLKEGEEIVLTAAKSLTFSGSATGAISIQAWGFVI
jgi:hypothetical protein